MWGIKALSLLVLGWWAWLWCGDGGLWEGCHLLMFPGVIIYLGEQSLGLGSPTSGVQAQPLTVVPKPHKPHRTEDKPPRLLVKATFNTPQNPNELTPKSSSISRKVSVPVVNSVGSAQSQISPYSSL